MLDKIDLSKKVGKEEYQRMMPVLSERLFNVEKGTWDAGIPVVILFEGWDAAGKGTSIQKLTQPLDPRGYKLNPIRAARTFEKNTPGCGVSGRSCQQKANGQSLTAPGTVG